MKHMTLHFASASSPNYVLERLRLPKHWMLLEGDKFRRRFVNGDELIITERTTVI